LRWTGKEDHVFDVGVLGKSGVKGKGKMCLRAGSILASGFKLLI
jgi:hypothetical protein